MKTLYLIRGLPGSGKSTLGEKLTGDGGGFGRMFAADDFFIDENGNYNYRPELIAEAHADCEHRTREAMERGYTPIVVANTFVARRHMEPYRALAWTHGYYNTFELIVEADRTDEELAERNEHGVPENVIARMRATFEYGEEDISIEDHRYGAGRVTSFYDRKTGNKLFSLVTSAEDTPEQFCYEIQSINTRQGCDMRRLAKGLTAAATYVENIERAVRERAQKGTKG